MISLRLQVTLKEIVIYVIIFSNRIGSVICWLIMLWEFNWEYTKVMIGQCIYGFDEFNSGYQIINTRFLLIRKIPVLSATRFFFRIIASWICNDAETTVSCMPAYTRTPHWNSVLFCRFIIRKDLIKLCLSNLADCDGPREKHTKCT